MASTPSDRLGLRLIGTGDFQDTWGSSLNSDALSLIDEGIAGVETIALSGDVTLSTTQYVSNQSRNRVLRFTNNSLSGTPTVTLPATERFYIIHNALGGTYGITFSNGSATVSVAANITTALIWQTGSVLYGIDLATGTDVATVAPQISNNNLQAVAGQIAPTNNIATLAGINADITTVATPAYKALVEVVGEATYKALVEVVGESGYKAFVETVGNATYKALVETVGNATYKALVETVGETNYKAVVETVGNATYKALVEVVGESVYKGKVETVAEATYKSQIEDLNDATYKAQLQDIATSPYKPLIQTVGNATYKALVEVVGESTYKALVETVGNATYKALVEVVGESVYKGKVETVGNTSNMASVNTVANSMNSIGDFAKVYQVSTNNPTARGNGDTPLLAGDLAYVTSSNKLRTYNATLGAWEDAGSSVSGLRQIYQYVATANQTVFPATGTITYDQTAGGAAISIFLNGVLLKTTDYTATNGTSITLASGAALNDEVTIHTFGTFNAANTYSQSETNTLLADKAPLASPNFSGTPQISGVDIATTASIPASGNTVQLTASGAIADGDAVIINTNGTTSKITGAVGGAAGKTAYTSANVNYNSGCFHTAQNVTVIAYRDGTDGGKGKIIAASLNASTNTFTFGTEVIFEADPITGVDVCYDSSSELVHIMYLDTGSQYATLRSYSFSGTTPTAVTSSTAINGTQVSAHARISYDSHFDQLVVAWRDISSSNVGRAQAFNYSSGAYTSGGMITFASALTFGIQSAYDPVNYKHVIGYQDPNSYCLAATLTVSGTGASPTIAFNGSVNVNTDGPTAQGLQYHPASGKMLFIYKETSIGYVSVGTFSGSSYGTWTAKGDAYKISEKSGTTNTFSNDAEARYGYDEDTQRLVVTYGGNSSDGAMVVAIGVSGTSITLAGPQQFDTNPSYYHGTVYDTSQNVAIATFHDQGDGNKGTVAIVRFDSTNLTTSNFIGFSNSAVADGNTATIQTTGNVTDAQTGLTAATGYFVQIDGSLNTTAHPTIGVPAGKALSATKLLIA